MTKTATPLEREGGERRAKILAEAQKVFFDEGYEGACIDDVIKRTGGSKRTIYNEFGNKEGLFAAMVADLVSTQSKEIVARFDWDEKSGVGLRQALLDYARALMSLLYSARVLALYRTILGEARRFPKIAQAFFDNGPGRTVGRLAEMLEHYRDSGEIRVADCRMAADQFAGLVRDNYYLAVLLGLQCAPTAAEIEARAEAAVDIFLGGIATS